MDVTIPDGKWDLYHLDDVLASELLDSDSDSLRRIERCHRRDRIPCAILVQRLQLPTLPTLLMLHCLRGFGHTAWRAPGEFMRELINSDVAQTWRKRTGGQLKTSTTTLKEDLVRLIAPAVVGIRRWSKEWASIVTDLAQNCCAWSAAVRDAVNDMDADSA